MVYATTLMSYRESETFIHDTEFWQINAHVGSLVGKAWLISCTLRQQC